MSGFHERGAIEYTKNTECRTSNIYVPVFDEVNSDARLLLTVYFSTPAESGRPRAEVTRAEAARDTVLERADTAAVDTSDKLETLRGVPAVKKSPV